MERKLRGCLPQPIPSLGQLSEGELVLKLVLDDLSDLSSKLAGWRKGLLAEAESLNGQVGGEKSE